MVKALNPRSRCLWFDSHSAGHVQEPWASFESTPPLSIQQEWVTGGRKNWYCVNGLGTAFSPDREACGRVSTVTVWMFFYVQEMSAEALLVSRKHVDEYRELYDKLCAEDKVMDRGFKREFSDVPAHFVDQLYKLFRRRPR